MKWQEDLFRDIRTGTAYDDQDSGTEIPHPSGAHWDWNWDEVTDQNRAYLRERFLRVKNNCPAILEIGVNRETNGEKTSTGILLTNKNPDTIYIGIDIDDKSSLDDPVNNVFTICSSSMDVENNLEKIRKLGIKEFGFIFIDGWHSINAVLTEWEYTRMLSPNGIVGFHDTSCHPGPYHFLNNMNTDIWQVEPNLCPQDHGIGFAQRKWVAQRKF